MPKRLQQVRDTESIQIIKQAPIRCLRLYRVMLIVCPKMYRLHTTIFDTEKKLLRIYFARTFRASSLIDLMSASFICFSSFDSKATQR